MSIYADQVWLLLRTGAPAWTQPVMPVMPVMPVIPLAIGGAVGATGRYLIDRAVQSRHGGTFPFGTLVVNVIGSLVLGGLVGAGERVPYAWSLLLGSGLCGALTTYSTFSFESWRLVEERRLASALGNALGTVVLCVAAAASGFVLVQGVVGGTG